MSRTQRNPRPQFYAARVPKSVRDGADQYVSVHCKHNNACDWCRRNRTFSSARRMPA